MATIDLSGLTKYTDQLSQSLIREAVLMPSSFDYVRKITNVPYSTAVNIMNSTLIAKAGGCGAFSATGSVPLKQVELRVCPMKVEENICNDDLKQYWLGQKMPNGSYVEDLSPAEFAQVYTADKVDKLSALIEDYFWVGSTSNHYSNGLTLCNGILEKLEYTSMTSSTIDGNAISGTTSTYSGALNVSTAIAVIDNMINNLTSSSTGKNILKSGKLVLFMDYVNFNTLVRALRNVNYFHTNIGQESVGAGRWEFDFPGQPIKIVAVKGLPSTKMVLTTSDNFIFGTDNESDYSNFKIWYDVNDDEVRFRSKFKIGATIAFPQYVVLYA